MGSISDYGQVGSSVRGAGLEWLSAVARETEAAEKLASATKWVAVCHGLFVDALRADLGCVPCTCPTCTAEMARFVCRDIGYGVEEGELVTS